MRTVTALLLLMTACNASAVDDSATLDASIRQVMRDLGIRYLVSEDRKLPKSDRAKWEADLAGAVDFESLNQGMRERIKTALGAGAADLDQDKSDHLATKAVLFMIPRELSDTTMLYLRERENGGPLATCSETFRPAADQVLALCVRADSAQRAQVRFVDSNGDEALALVFEQTDRWRLADIDKPITERELMLIARWK